MGIVAWVLLGAIAGYAATIIIGDRQALASTLIVGIIGAVVGGFVAAEVLHRGSVSGLNLESGLIAVAGAFVVLAGWRFLVPRGAGQLRY